MSALREKARRLWTKCRGCGLYLERAVYVSRLGVCPRCGHHHRLDARERAAFLFDPGSFEPLGLDLRTTDPLRFADGEYMREAHRAGMEAMVYGRAEIEGRPCAAALMNFTSFGGSMGTVVGEIFRRACGLSLREGLPLLVVTASGGARMQEGTPALLQMAKTVAALLALEEEGLPVISLLCDPTCGGVTAGFASYADILLAEPGALICFSGPRVVEQTTGAKPPPGFCRAEYLWERGLVDKIVPRDRQRGELARLLDLLSVKGARGERSSRSGRRRSPNTATVKTAIDAGRPGDASTTNPPSNTDRGAESKRPVKVPTAEGEGGSERA
jgi:acetyl-CoA carboxylase carboxyl transferase subunit beta